MDEAARTLYDDLGVGFGASADDLRRAYRALARRLHPDVNEELANDERMRLVNQAWAILSDPSARERYDQTLRQSEAQSPVPAPTSSWSVVAAEPPASLRWLRPSMIAVGVLTIIFVATAYAGPHPGSSPTTTTGSSAVISDRPPAGGAVPALGAAAGGVPAGGAMSGQASSDMVGKCLLGLTGYDAIVPCFEHNDGLVVAQTTHSADCPPNTSVHQLAGRSQFVCLAGRTP